MEILKSGGKWPLGPHAGKSGKVPARCDPRSEFWKRTIQMNWVGAVGAPSASGTKARRNRTDRH